jgi:hypothetical protein
MKGSTQQAGLSKVAIAALIVAILVALALFWNFFNPRPYANSTNRSRSPNANPSEFSGLHGNDSQSKVVDVIRLKQLIDQHLAHTESQVDALEELGYPFIDALFVRAFTQIHTYSETCLSWTSKWRFIRDRFPWNDGLGHERFLKQKFEEQLLSPSDLEQAIRQSVLERFAKVRDLENEMLLRMRADIADLPEYATINTTSDEQLASEFQAALRSAAETVSEDLSSDIESQLVSLVAGEVLAQVAVRLGVSAGVLGTGAASGWATFGIGLLAAIVVDQIVSRLWDYFASPELELSIELSKSLSQLKKLICEGDSETIGLDGQLRHWSSQRAILRKKAIYSLFHLPSDPQQNLEP